MEVTATATVLLHCPNMTYDTYGTTSLRSCECHAPLAGAENVAERIQYPDLACMSRSTQHALAHARIQWLKVLPAFDLSTVPPCRMCNDGLTFNYYYFCVDRLTDHVHFVVDGAVSLTGHFLNIWKSCTVAPLHNQR